MGTILHITSKSDWMAALASGRYRADTLATQGFIHCSKPDQVIAVANALFCNRTDLVLLEIDEARVSSEIRYENLEGGSKLFPHIYGALNVDAVSGAAGFRPDSDGRFTLPGEFCKEFE